MPRCHSFQRTGGRCEPGRDSLAAATGAGRPNEQSSRASRACPRYQGTDLLESERARVSVKPGGTAVKLLSSRKHKLCFRDVFCV